jgi:Spy/CpxP family protein refolding chaperone
VINVPFAKFFPVIAAAFASTLSLAPAQSSPTPTPAPSVPAASSHAAGQIGPGTTGTISPSQGVTPTAAAKAGKILKGALTPKTRQTLQEAMNAVTPQPADTFSPASAATSANATAPAVTNAPPSAAGH